MFIDDKTYMVRLRVAASLYPQILKERIEGVGLTNPAPEVFQLEQVAETTVNALLPLRGRLLCLEDALDATSRGGSASYVLLLDDVFVCMELEVMKAHRAEIYLTMWDVHHLDRLLEALIMRCDPLMQNVSTREAGLLPERGGRVHRKGATIVKELREEDLFCDRNAGKRLFKREVVEYYLNGMSIERIEQFCLNTDEQIPTAMQVVYQGYSHWGNAFEVVLMQLESQDGLPMVALSDEICRLFVELVKRSDICSCLRRMTWCGSQKIGYLCPGNF